MFILSHPSNVAACCSDTADGQSNATSWFGDEGALPQCVVNTIDAVLLHGQQETTAKKETSISNKNQVSDILVKFVQSKMFYLPGHLWSVGAGIEQCRWGVGEPLFWQQVVRLNGCIDVSFVNPDGHSHQHVLGSLSHCRDMNLISDQTDNDLKKSKQQKLHF